MRVYTKNNDQYLSLLAASIYRDPASMESWNCLHIKPKNKKISVLNLNKLRANIKKYDCDIVICKDGDLLLISDDMAESDLMTESSDIIEIAEEIDCYNLMQDWKIIYNLLTAKTNHLLPYISKISNEENFEIEEIGITLEHAKKERKSRNIAHVMLVEDDPLTRRIVANSIKQDYVLITAQDAYEALTNYMIFAPDIVFLDIGLPNVSGFSALQKIMETDPDAYIVMFSSNGYLDNVTKALNSGASGFITKPFRKDKMYKYIEDSTIHHQGSAF